VAHCAPTRLVGVMSEFKQIESEV